MCNTSVNACIAAPQTDESQHLRVQASEICAIYTHSRASINPSVAKALRPHAELNFCRLRSLVQIRLDEKRRLATASQPPGPSGMQPVHEKG
eukprot:3287618-Pleurochrysis_carterae.AAC.4